VHGAPCDDPRVRLQRVCVYAGSSPGGDPAYADAARRLGTLLAERGIGVVFGGAHAGLMGAVADAALAVGGEVIGVLPRALEGRETGHTGLTELHVVETMHERKALMAELADAFVALPGGLGTLEELVEAATWTQLGIHDKPVGLLDVARYWQDLERLLDHAVRERFLRAENRSLVVRSADPAALLDMLAGWERPQAGRRLDRDDAARLFEPVPRAPSVGVSALVVRDGRLLLGLRRGAHGAGTWSPPGGAVDAGEDPAATALRELEEETGLVAATATPAGFTNDVFPAERQHWITLHHLVEGATGDPVNREPHRCERLAFFPLDALPAPLFTPLRALLATGWPPGAGG
jgi:uncharacterized protein (TIGR00730 family)